MGTSVIKNPLSPISVNIYPWINSRARRSRESTKRTYEQTDEADSSKRVLATLESNFLNKQYVKFYNDRVKAPKLNKKPRYSDTITTAKSSGILNLLFSFTKEWFPVPRHAKLNCCISFFLIEYLWLLVLVAKSVTSAICHIPIVQKISLTVMSN